MTEHYNDRLEVSEVRIEKSHISCVPASFPKNQRSKILDTKDPIVSGIEEKITMWTFLPKGGETVFPRQRNHANGSWSYIWEYIIKHVRDSNLENRENKASVIASALFEVLCTVSKAAGLQALANKDSAKSELFVPYNILPLDQGGVIHAIMQLPEIKDAVFAVCNLRGLLFLEDFKKRVKGNVANQRYLWKIPEEHLTLLLANTHIRKIPKQTNVSLLGDEAINELMKKFFKNYTNWCKFLGEKKQHPAAIFQTGSPTI
ncbi:putative callose synthase 8 [Camellia lanceoleosa]|uniref:Callose synthase 8 n=1 Tax=Camellia lanceoleosa TaxID=1840588 RepID=A0ACC0GLD2_9ERIC|nr:putative callose synthase 8 [Camellia lanceoleosa]